MICVSAAVHSIHSLVLLISHDRCVDKSRQFRRAGSWSGRIMSFGFSLGDLKSASELGFWIYDKCFTKAERAGKSQLLYHETPTAAVCSAIALSVHPTFHENDASREEILASLISLFGRVVDHGLIYSLFVTSNRCQVPSIWQGYSIPRQKPTTATQRN